MFIFVSNVDEICCDSMGEIGEMGEMGEIEWWIRLISNSSCIWGCLEEEEYIGHGLLNLKIGIVRDHLSLSTFE